jgi:tetratricopeptide (TPR) repeat protein
MKTTIKNLCAPFTELPCVEKSLALSLITFLMTVAVGIAAPMQNLSTKADESDSLHYLQQLRRIQQNPKNIDALLLAGRLATQIAGRSLCAERKKSLLVHASNLSSTAIQVDFSNCQAHLNFIVALGMLAETATSPREKLRHARLIESEAQLIIKLDPNCASAHFVLGKLNEAIAGMSMMERLVAETLFGGVPHDMSYENAKYHYGRAISLRPNYILFHYGLAKTQLAIGDELEALQTLKYALSLDNVEDDDIVRKENCRILMFKVKSSSL